jgi:hypothetical protein
MTMRILSLTVLTTALGALLVSGFVARPAGSKGAVAGKPCPSFSYKTIDGKTVSDQTLRGKAFIIDVWSPT